MKVIDGQVWRGLFKTQEEMGELGQVLGKLGPYPYGNHPDGGYNLEIRATMEIADVYASLDYLVATNDLDMRAIMERRAAKLALFRQWVLTGIPVDQEPKK